MTASSTDMPPNCCYCRSQVLEALAEIAFEPQFLPTRIEKERKAVLAEAQMMNTIEYRIDCQLLAHLHAENNLGCR
jgi:predicted Zn-dependent peptidase